MTRPIALVLGAPAGTRYTRSAMFVLSSGSDWPSLVLAPWQPQAHGSHIPLGHQDRPVQEKWSLRRHRPLTAGTHCIRLSAVGSTSTLTLQEPEPSAKSILLTGGGPSSRGAERIAGS
jgi:hypothetical protein